MLRSMTGYGRAEVNHAVGVMVCEVRSVNHRYLETSVRLPEEVRILEPAVRELIGKKVKRGKVDLSFKLTLKPTDRQAMAINTDLARQIIEAAESLRAPGELGSPLDPLTILGWPGVVQEPDIDVESLKAAAKQLVSDALDDFVASREREGEKIQAMLTERLEGVSAASKVLRGNRSQVVERQEAKLRAKLAELDVSVDENRLEQELVYAAQRLDVDEELDRLDAHVSEMQNIFKRKEPVGRRLDFLIQEFNREANTLSSKSSDTDTTASAVDLKVLIEQMREQVQNVE